MKHWLIFFEDKSIPPEVFTDGRAAKRRFKDLNVSWYCTLFEEVSSPANVEPSAEPNPAGGKQE